MRTIVLTLFVVLGLGLIGPSHMAAAPMDGTALARAANAGTLLADTHYVRRHGRICYRKCYYEFVIGGRRICRTFC